MNLDQKLMYAFRGWIAFVAFMDLGVAFRSFIEKRCFLGEYSETKAEDLHELSKYDSCFSFDLLKLPIFYINVYIYFKHTLKTILIGMRQLLDLLL